MSQAVSTSGSLLSVIANPGSGSPAECGVTYIESLDLANPAVLRELDSGSYVLYGKFKAYSGDDTIIVFESKLNANIVKSTDCSSIMIFNPVNSKVECLTIYDNRYERTDVALQDVDAHIGQLKNELAHLSSGVREDYYEEITETVSVSTHSSNDAVDAVWIEFFNEEIYLKSIKPLMSTEEGTYNWEIVDNNKNVLKSGTGTIGEDTVINHMVSDTVGIGIKGNSCVPKYKTKGYLPYFKNMVNKGSSQSLEHAVICGTYAFKKIIPSADRDSVKAIADEKIMSALTNSTYEVFTDIGALTVAVGNYCVVFKDDVLLKSWKPIFDVDSGVFLWAYITFESNAKEDVGGTVGEIKTANIGDTLTFDIDTNRKVGICIFGSSEYRLKYSSGGSLSKKGIAAGNFNTETKLLWQYLNGVVLSGEYRIETREEVYARKSEVVSAPVNYLSGKVLSVTGDSEAYGHTIGVANNYGTLISNRNKMILHQYAINGRKLCTGETTSLVDTYTEIASDSDYIIVHIGYNDTFDSSVADNSTDKNTYKGAFNVLINGLQTNYPNAKILVIVPYYYDNTQTRIDRAEWMKQRCKYFKIRCFDGCENGGIRRGVDAMSDYFIDNVHLTAKGHSRMSYLYEAQLRLL